MSEPEVTGSDLILPSGELISLGDAAACVRALDELRDLEYRIRELKGLITDAIQDESRRQGTKTLSLSGGIQAVVQGGQKVLWDAQALEASLREAGMSEERIREVVVYGGGSYYPGAEHAKTFHGDMVGGQMQYMWGTFKGHYRHGLDALRAKGFKVTMPDPSDVQAWLMPMGQAIAAGWARWSGNDDSHWSASFGNGC